MLHGLTFLSYRLVCSKRFPSMKMKGYLRRTATGEGHVPNPESHESNDEGSDDGKSIDEPESEGLRDETE